MSKNSAVRVWTEAVAIPTYLPLAPDKNPMFLERRVYQGSSGKVYPLPFTNRICETKSDRRWKVVGLENEYLRMIILPELGGRIHAIRDKTNDYDVIYNQAVIKPALVGLAGPWISGGIEFNWPQHHRPATFLPVDVEIEKASDGSITVWCSDHDPMVRMKGMHGVCLHPGKAYLQLKVRAYNRTAFVQPFLWWANVATRVHEAYQSFFPPDVRYVADHAKRAVSEYPLCKGFYYGINYGKRSRNGTWANEIPSNFIPPHSGGTAPVFYQPNDLSFYANIPTPCSYMCMNSQEDFFGGYDFKNKAGIVHIANHHISPGKKQWTWGNHSFGYAWDRNLTDADPSGEYAPYIELMAGVYTDNQPDFSFLQPGETKRWSQYWYPIQRIGPASHANLQAALSLNIENNEAQVGVSVTEDFPKSTVKVFSKQKLLAHFSCDLAPGKPILKQTRLPKGVREPNLSVRVISHSGSEIISYQVKPRTGGSVPLSATEPPPPKEVQSTDELFVIGLHLEQYHHATRNPTAYWYEALRRDRLDARSNNALGRWLLKHGEFVPAEHCFRRAIERLTQRNPNTYDSEPYYNLGLTLRLLGRDGEAYHALYKATWNQAWAAAGFHALAEINCCRCDWATALEHLDHSLRFDAENLRARDLKGLVLQKLDRFGEAENLLGNTLQLDPLDWWARAILGQELSCDTQTRLDLAHDFASAGFYAEAIELLSGATATESDLLDQNWGTAPLVHYTLGWLHEKSNHRAASIDCYKRAAAVSPDYCFPARLQEIIIFESAIRANPKDARAHYYLGNLLYDRQRHKEAIKLWECSAKLNQNFSITWRNLGIGYFNILKKPAKARAAYDRAVRANSTDARLLYERDQLWARLGEKPQKRLQELEAHPDLVGQRDDLSMELCALYNLTGNHPKALQIISTRKFQPWEGGEGQALGQHVRTHLALGRGALSRGDYSNARTHFEQALESPENLGEAKHVLANQSDIHYWFGVLLDSMGERVAARKHWSAAAAFKGDFQKMSVRAYSEMTYYSAMALQQLGKSIKARKLFSELLAYGKKLQRSQSKIDYFAASLPTLLLFDDDLQFRQETTALFLQAQANLGLGRRAKAKGNLAEVLRRDPNHAGAADLLNESNQFERITKSPVPLTSAVPEISVNGHDGRLTQEIPALSRKKPPGLHTGYSTG